MRNENIFELVTLLDTLTEDYSADKSSTDFVV